eukprot:TRINITY_DN21217_c0_g3_i1.p1 TRINITY_DN21217_c0_g3~~TRINITY_DN21217_c0_g3_i1.p1  ORF type:complete len:1329 (+),score=305.05 TRINITY_DN21217_c0_g3_i1:88-4074(+)
MVRADAARRLEDAPERSKAALLQLSVAELRRLAADRGISLHGCVEKSDIAARLAAAPGASRLVFVDSDGDRLELVRPAGGGAVELWVNGQVQEGDCSDIVFAAGSVRVAGIVATVVSPAPHIFEEQLGRFKRGEPLAPVPAAVSLRELLQGDWDTPSGRVTVRGAEVRFADPALAPAELEERSDGALLLLGGALLPAAATREQLLWSDGDVWSRAVHVSDSFGRHSAAAAKRRHGASSPRGPSSGSPPSSPPQRAHFQGGQHHRGKRMATFAVGLAAVLLGVYASSVHGVPQEAKGGRVSPRGLRRRGRGEEEGEGGDVGTPAPTPEPPPTPAPTRQAGAWRVHGERPFNWNCAGRAQDDALASADGVESLAECGQRCELVTRSRVLAYWTKGRRGRCRCYARCNEGDATKQGWDNVLYQWEPGASTLPEFQARSEDAAEGTPAVKETPAPTPAPTMADELAALAGWRQARGLETPPPTPRPPSLTLAANLSVCDRGVTWMLSNANNLNVKVPGSSSETAESWKECSESCKNSAEQCKCWSYDGGQCNLWMRCEAPTISSDARTVGGGRTCAPSRALTEWTPHTHALSWDCGGAPEESAALNAQECAAQCAGSSFLGFWTEGEGIGTCRCWESCFGGYPVTPNSDENIVLAHVGRTPPPPMRRQPCAAGMGYPLFLLMKKGSPPGGGVVFDSTRGTPRECSAACVKKPGCECFTFGGTGRCLLLQGQGCGVASVEDAGLISGPAGCVAPRTDWAVFRSNYDCGAGGMQGKPQPTADSMLTCQSACRANSSYTALAIFPKTGLCLCYPNCEAGGPMEKGVSNVVMKLKEDLEDDNAPAPQASAPGVPAAIRNNRLAGLSGDARDKACWWGHLRKGPRADGGEQEKFLMVSSFTTGFATAVKQQLLPLMFAAVASKRAAVLPHATLGALPSMRSTACDPAYVPLRTLLDVSALTRRSPCIRTRDHSEWLAATGGVVDVGLVIGTPAELDAGQIKIEPGSTIDWTCVPGLLQNLQSPGQPDARYWGGNQNWDGEARHVFAVERLAIRRLGCVPVKGADSAIELLGSLAEARTIMVLNWPGATRQGPYWWQGGQQLKRVFTDLASAPKGQLCGVPWPPREPDRVPVAEQWRELARLLIAEWFGGAGAEFSCVHVRAEKLILRGAAEIRPVKGGAINVKVMAQCFRDIGKLVEGHSKSAGHNRVFLMHDMGDTGTHAMTRDARMRAWARGDTGAVKQLLAAVPGARYFCGSPEASTITAAKAGKGVQAVLAAAAGNCAMAEAAVCRQASAMLRFGSGAHGRFASFAPSAAVYASCADIALGKTVDGPATSATK